MKNFDVCFLTNFAGNLDEIQCIATACFVEAHARFIKFSMLPQPVVLLKLMLNLLNSVCCHSLLGC